MQQYSNDSIGEEVVSLRKYVLELVELDDDVTLTELFEQQRELTTDVNSNSAVSENATCHPLCRCKRCCGDLTDEQVGNRTFDVNSVVAPRNRTGIAYTSFPIPIPIQGMYN